MVSRFVLSADDGGNGNHWMNCWSNSQEQILMLYHQLKANPSFKRCVVRDTSTPQMTYIAAFGMDKKDNKPMPGLTLIENGKETYVGTTQHDCG
jgi:hypothetical protein